jgi:hypoxanthine phosphoribosyltransferase
VGTLMDKKKVYIDYNQFGIKLRSLYEKILGDGVPYQIIGIASGGLNLSYPLARWLRCSNHVSISIHFYEGEKLHGKPYFADIPTIPNNWKNILLVDDILDSGTTIKYFIEKTGLIHGENFKIATLHWNPKGLHGMKPDYYIDKKKESEWIVYPWEEEFIETFK